MGVFDVRGHAPSFNVAKEAIGDFGGELEKVEHRLAVLIKLLRLRLLGFGYAIIEHEDTGRRGAKPRVFYLARFTDDADVHAGARIAVDEQGWEIEFKLTARPWTMRLLSKPHDSNRACFIPS